MPEGKIEITAIVKGFAPNAVSDSYDDGTFMVFHKSTIEIVKPDELAGQKLEILHDSDIADGDPWRTDGATLCFRARASDLAAKNKTLFKGAVSEPCR